MTRISDENLTPQVDQAIVADNTAPKETEEKPVELQSDVTP